MFQYRLCCLCNCRLQVFSTYGTEQHVPHQYSQCFDLISGSDDHGRYKRQTGSNTACNVYAIAEYRYIQHMGQINMFPINTLSALILFQVLMIMDVTRDKLVPIQPVMSMQLQIIDIFNI